MQGVRLLGIGTQFFMQNLAGGTFIRVGTLIRQCIVLSSGSQQKNPQCVMYEYGAKYCTVGHV